MCVLGGGGEELEMEREYNAHVVCVFLNQSIIQMVVGGGRKSVYALMINSHSFRQLGGVREEI